MAWTDITAPEVGDATKKVSFADAVIGNLVYLKANMGGSGGGGGGSLVVNGNFELDGDSDGIPDGWDLTEYTAGAFALDTTNQGHGASGIMFTSPGGTGGGDIQSTDFFPVGPGKFLAVDFVHWSSVAGVHDVVEVRWFSAASEPSYLSTSTIYDSTANPTSKTRFVGFAAPPSTARFAKLKIVGAKNDNATAGISRWDDFEVSTPMPGTGWVDGASVAEGYTEAQYPNFAEVGTVTLPLPTLSANSVVRATAWPSVMGQNANGGGPGRIRLGSAYSNEIPPGDLAYLEGLCVVTARGVSGPTTLGVQVVCSGAGQYTYGKLVSQRVLFEILAP